MLIMLLGVLLGFVGVGLGLGLRAVLVADREKLGDWIAYWYPRAVVVLVSVLGVALGCWLVFHAVCWILGFIVAAMRALTEVHATVSPDAYQVDDMRSLPDVAGALFRGVATVSVTVCGVSLLYGFIRKGLKAWL